MTSNVFMITCAYEQGVGKGHQAFNRKTEIDNPYIDSVCNEAWGLGYKEGKAQAERLQQADPVAVVRQEFGRGAQSISWSERDLAGLPDGTLLYTGPQTAIPQGYKLVPVEPTSEMLAEFKRAYKDGSFWLARIHGAVCAMLAAAPEAPSTGLNLNCKSVQKRLATLWGYVKGEAPVIHANFETTKGVGWTGKTSAPVKRVEHNDDGSYTVVIDYWPQP